MKKKTTTGGLSLFAFLLVLTMFVQVAQAQQEVRNLDLMAIEHWYDDIANRSLERFFPKDRFLVSVRAELRQVEGFAPGAGQPSEVAGSDGGNLTFSIQNRLPGLPALGRSPQRSNTPNTTRQPGSEPAAASVTDLARVRVSVWLDETLTEGDVQWAEEVLESMLKLNSSRGDQIAVTRRSLSAWEPPVASRNEGQTRFESEVLDTDETRLAQSPNFWSRLDAFREELRVRSGLPIENWMILAVAGFLFTLFAGLIWWLISRRKKADKMADSPDRRANLPDRPLAPSVAPSSTPSDNGHDARFSMGRVIASDIDNRVEAIQFLLQMFMQFPEEMARMVDQWITSDPVYGGERAAILVANVDRKMLNRIKPYLSQQAYTELSRRMQEVQQQSRFAVEMLESCAKDIQKRLYEDEGRLRLHILQYFDFLYHVEDDILMQLIRQQRPEVGAFILYHLPYNRVSDIMKQLPAQTAQSILLQLPKVRLSLHERFETMATHLFDATRFLGEQSSFSESDVLQTLQIIENLDESLVQDYLLRFEQEDVAFAGQLRRHLILPESLSEVDPDLLTEGARSFPLQRMAIMFSLMDAVLKEMVLSVYSSREKIILLNESMLAQRIPQDVKLRERDAFVRLLRELRHRKTMLISNRRHLPAPSPSKGSIM